MLRLWEKIFVIAMLIYTMGAVWPFMFGAQNLYAPTESNPYQLAIQSCFYAAAFWFIAIHWRTVLHGAWNAKWIICLTLFAIASTAWSEYPELTLRRSVLLVATTAFGIYFGSRFTVPQQLSLLAWTCAFVVVSSFAIALLLPGYGVDHLVHPGDWQGAFTQKNNLARAMVFAVLVFYFARPWMGRAVRWLAITGACALLIRSRSVTGILVFGVIIATLPLYRLVRARVTVAIPVVIAFVLGAAGFFLILTSSSTDVFQILHRSPSLTGRTDLWAAVVMAIAKKPFLGYGFHAFWQGMAGESASVLLAVQWLVPHAHNGFLDLMLDLGLLGLVTFAVGYFVAWRRAIELMKRAHDPVAVWLCTYLVFMFVYNLTESSILRDNNIFWVLYTATAVSLSLSSRAQPAILEQDSRRFSVENGKVAVLAQG
jgi:O-antigen ligase